jgi:hypothetical protein
VCIVCTHTHTHTLCIYICKRMRIQCAELTYHLLMKAPHFTFECEERREGAERGIEVKVFCVCVCVCMYIYIYRERERERERENMFYMRELV